MSIVLHASSVSVLKRYECIGSGSETSAKQCVQAGPSDDTTGAKFSYTLATCRLACGLINLPLWPMPVSVVLNGGASDLIEIADLDLKIEYNTSASAVSVLLTNAFAELKSDLNLPEDSSGLPLVNVQVAISSSDTDLLLSTDESYLLEVPTNPC